MNESKLQALLLHALETKRGAVHVYRTALECALDKELARGWTTFAERTEAHEQRLTGLLVELGVDPEQQVTSREVMKHFGSSLVAAMRIAQQDADDTATELIAAECVLMAETKARFDCELLTAAARRLTGAESEALRAVCEPIENEGDEHYQYARRWCRALHASNLDLPAISLHRAPLDGRPATTH